MSDRRSFVAPVPAAAWAGRDAGKNFLITEWPAPRAEEWAWGMVLALKGTTAEIPEDVARLGMVGVGIRLLNSFLAADVDYARVRPLLADMLECVQVVLDPKNVAAATGLPVATPLRPDSVSEVPTLQWLRSEVIRAHTNFSAADFLSAFLDQMRSWRPPIGAPSTTETSPTSSAPSSAATPS